MFLSQYNSFLLPEGMEFCFVLQNEKFIFVILIDSIIFRGKYFGPEMYLVLMETSVLYNHGTRRKKMIGAYRESNIRCKNTNCTVGKCRTISVLLWLPETKFLRSFH